MKIATKLLFLIALSFTVGCQAGNSAGDFPESCVEQGVEFNGKNLVLGEGLYLFHNISDNSFWLNHPLTKDPGASAGWGSEIGAGNWSALAISNDMKNFAINCSTFGDAGVDYLNCEEVIKSCKIEKAAFNSGDSGSYWVAEDKPLQDLIEAIKGRGISW